jgi:hypothetical protein
MSSYSGIVSIKSDSDEIGIVRVAVDEGDNVIVMTVTDEDGATAAAPMDVAEALDLIARLSAAVAAAVRN